LLYLFGVGGKERGSNLITGRRQGGTLKRFNWLLKEGIASVAFSR